MFNKSFLILIYFTLLQIHSIQREPLLVLNMADLVALPRNFRTAQDPFKIFEEPFPSRQGLDTLRLSGSAQFSNHSLQFLLEHFATPTNVYIVDLRQECHGFMNGEAVSWYGVKNWANVGKSLSEIERIETQLLNQALNQKIVQLATITKKDLEENYLPTATFASLNVKSVSNEKDLVHQAGIHYVRIPLTDHVRPTDEAVDRLVSLVQYLPSSAWLHIHCAAGMGRTTTFMAVIDMMKNAKFVSFNDIIQRQFFIGGLNLKKQGKSKRPWKSELAIERLEFLNNFYHYCKTNQDQFHTSWSLYLLQQKYTNYN
jgi:predicted protein tyrosine phosphatase